MYVSVKGGEAAIANAHRLLDDRRRGDRTVPALTLEQIAQPVGSSAVDRVMAEGSLYDPRTRRHGRAPVARRSDRGDLPAPRLSHHPAALWRDSSPAGHGQAMRDRAARSRRPTRICRAASCSGPTFDYTHRLIDPAMAGDDPVEHRNLRRPLETHDDATDCPRVTDLLGDEGADRAGRDPADHRTSPAIRSDVASPLEFPAGRDLRLQSARPRRRGVPPRRSPIPPSAATPAPIPSSARLRIGLVEVEVEMPELGFAVLDRPGSRLTECQMVNQFKGSANRSRHSSPAATASSLASPSARPWP